jgi:hypothetical protein
MYALKRRRNLRLQGALFEQVQGPKDNLALTQLRHLLCDLGSLGSGMTQCRPPGL